MCVPSIFRRARQQVDAHDANQVEKATEETGKEPYKHVPTHAASDALASVPPTWDHGSRARAAKQAQDGSGLVPSQGEVDSMF